MIFFLSRHSQPQPTDEDEEANKSLRCLQMYVNIANIINHELIFTWKLVSLGVAIISGYAAIAHFKEHAIFGIGRERRSVFVFSVFSSPCQRLFTDIVL